MVPVLRLALRRFAPFESAIRKQFDHFLAATGTRATLEAVPMELEDLAKALVWDAGLKGGAWDIGLLVTDWLPMAAEDGHLADLGPLAADLPVPGAPECWPLCLREFQAWRGSMWAVPYHDGPQCLIYRTDLLPGAAARFADRHGRPLAPPRTWDEFVQVARALTDPERRVWGTAVAGFPDAHNTVYDFCAQVWSRGGHLAAKDGRPVLDGPEAREGLAFHRWLVRESGLAHPGSMEADSVGSGAIFARGEVAMMANWFGFAAHAVRDPASPVRGRVGVAPMPHGQGATSAAVLVYWTLVVGAGSRHKDLAWRFLCHAASGPMDRLLTLEGAIGCRTETWTDPEVAAQIPFAGEMPRLHALARTLPADRRLPGLAAIIDRAVGAALRTDDATDLLLIRAQEEANRLWETKP